jgi:hypothetical protein
VALINASKEALIATCKALIAGLPALPDSATVVSAGKTLTRAQLLAPLKAYLPLPAATAAAKVNHTKAVAAESAAKEAAVAMINEVIQPYLRTRLGKSSPELEVYGLEPVKVPEKTAATKAAAVQKRQATRKALGTKGPRQKNAAKKALGAQR